MKLLTGFRKCGKMGSVVGVATPLKGKNMSARGKQSKSVLLGVALTGHARPQILVRSGQRPAWRFLCL